KRDWSSDVCSSDLIEKDCGNMSKKEIYVEIEIDGAIGDIWEKSQNPALHEQWDIRFSSITYLPKKKNDVQKFTYTRKILPFVEISDWVENVGKHTKGY